MTPAELASAVEDLPPALGTAYYAQYEKRMVDYDTYIALAWGLGIFGVHRFYVGHAGRGLIFLAFFLSGVVLLIAGLLALAGSAPGVCVALLLVGFACLAVEMVLWLVDVVRSRADVERRNSEIGQEILGALQPGRTHA